MKRNWIGTVVVVGVSMVAGLFFSQIWVQVLGQQGGFPVEQQPPSPQVVVKQQAELPKWCVDFAMVQPGVRVITIVDTETKKIAVYHMDMATGGVVFKSIRDIQPDLMVDQFNALSPLPVEIMKWNRATEQSKGKN